MAQLTQGTIGPIYCEREKTGLETEDTYINTLIKPGDSYYSIQIVGALITIPSALWYEKLFQNATQVTMTSSAEVANFADARPAQGINWVQDITPGIKCSLGARSMIADYYPASGTSLTIKVEYRVLEESPTTIFLQRLSRTINDNQSLVTTLSLNPGTAATVGTVATSSTIISNLITALFPPESEKTTLKFNGAWQLNGGLKSGFYFIMAAYEEQTLPSYNDAESFKVKRKKGSPGGQAVLVRQNDAEYNDCSYVILEVSTRPVLGKMYDPSWLKTYIEARRRADFFKQSTNNPTQAQRDQAWAVCEGLINQAKVLSDMDNRYLSVERDKHYESTRSYCMEKTLGIKPDTMINIAQINALKQFDFAVAKTAEIATMIAASRNMREDLL